MGCLCRGRFQLPPLPSLTEVVIACNEALRLIPARWESCWPCRTGCGGLEKLGAFPLPRSMATGLLTPRVLAPNPLASRCSAQRDFGAGRMPCHGVLSLLEDQMHLFSSL